LSIPDEYHRRRVILMSQFKAEAVGLELDMAGEQIEKRQARGRSTGKPSAEMSRVGKFAETPAPREPADGGSAQAIREPKSAQQEGSDDRQRLPVVAHDVMLQFVANGEFDLVSCLDRRQVALQNDAIGRAEAVHPRAFAADKEGDVSDAAPRGQPPVGIPSS